MYLYLKGIDILFRTSCWTFRQLRTCLPLPPPLANTDVGAACCALCLFRCCCGRLSCPVLFCLRCSEPITVDVLSLSLSVCLSLFQTLTLNSLYHFFLCLSPTHSYTIQNYLWEVKSVKGNSEPYTKLNHWNVNHHHIQMMKLL